MYHKCCKGTILTEIPSLSTQWVRWEHHAPGKTHSDFSKFDPYLFDPKNIYQHGKNRVFESWGYTIDDSRYLKAEIERQAREKYAAGEYALGTLNKYGQRISIRIEIPRKNGHGTVSFITGWKVCPHGEIRLNTPYGGK